MQEERNLERMLGQDTAQARLLQAEEEISAREKSFEDAIEAQTRQDLQQDARFLSLENETQRSLAVSLEDEWQCQAQRQRLLDETAQEQAANSGRIAQQSFAQQEELRTEAAALRQADERVAMLESLDVTQGQEAGMISKNQLSQSRDANFSQASQMSRQKSANRAEHRFQTAEAKRHTLQKGASLSAISQSKGSAGESEMDSLSLEENLQGGLYARSEGSPRAEQKGTAPGVGQENKADDREENASQNKSSTSGNKDQLGRDGTGTAPRDTDAMAAFFNTRHDYRDDASSQWQRLSYGGQSDQSQNQEYAPNNGSSAEYNIVALGQTLTPRLIELIQKLSSMGYNWARVVVPIDAQTKVVVRFNSQNGRVKIHLSAPTSGLCELIQSLWADLTQQVSRHGIVLDSPTFDTTPETSTYEH